MKLLIVDDNANNRMVLRLLLQDYGESNNTVYEIQECENGLEAVNKAKRDKYNIIFMDIMMPEMDGIEATKKIRHNNKEVMIIAVSAVDDKLRQKEILRNGAEDYIPKPIDSKVLNARLDNYFALLKLRNKETLTSHRKSSNLFTKEIYKRQTIFYVSSEEALAEFWEYYLLSNETTKIDGLSDVVRAVFSTGEAILALKGEPWIIVEEDNNALYFTINRVEVIGEMVVKLIMKKNKEVEHFKSNEEKLSFKLLKVCSEFGPEVAEDVQEKANKPEANPVLSDIKETNIEEYSVFHYMDPDDLAETEEVLGDLSSIMLMLGTSEVEPEEIMQIAKHLEKMGRGLSTYSESFQIGQSLISLGQSIEDHSQRFQEIASDLSTLSTAFVSDLQSWLKMTFYEGAPSVDFMDATINANTQTINAMLSMEDNVQSNEEMDDIFDF